MVLRSSFPSFGQSAEGCDEIPFLFPIFDRLLMNLVELKAKPSKDDRCKLYGAMKLQDS